MGAPAARDIATPSARSLRRMSDLRGLGQELSTKARVARIDFGLEHESREADSLQGTGLFD
jgi:hypothetical protein